MSRSMTEAVKAESEKQVVYPAILLEAQFISGWIYAWTGTGTITWNGHDYVGVGQFGTISPNSETVALEARNFTFGLRGVPNDLIKYALHESRPSFRATYRLAFMDASAAIIADPVIVGSGLIDVPTLSETGATSDINFTVENRLVDLKRRLERRYTDEDHQRTHPGDTFFTRVVAMQTKTLPWNRNGVSIFGMPIWV